MIPEIDHERNGTPLRPGPQGPNQIGTLAEQLRRAQQPRRRPSLQVRYEVLQMRVAQLERRMSRAGVPA